MNVEHEDPFADLSDGDAPTYYNHYRSDSGACTVCSLDEEEGLNYGCRIHFVRSARDAQRWKS